MARNEQAEPGSVGPMFVSDLRHFLDMPDEVPGPARKMAKLLGFWSEPLPRESQARRGSAR